MIEGIQQAAVTDWFVSNATNVSEPLKFELITGGHSNLTYKVTDMDMKQWGSPQATARACSTRCA